jgi:hypothetical protein
MTIPGTLLLLVVGLVFCVGFAAGSAFFARVLRARDQRTSRKIKALEYLRQHDGIELGPVVTALIDEERQEWAARRPRRWWSR